MSTDQYETLRHQNSADWDEHAAWLRANPGQWRIVSMRPSSVRTSATQLARYRLLARGLDSRLLVVISHAGRPGDDFTGTRTLAKLEAAAPPEPATEAP